MPTRLQRDRFTTRAVSISRRKISRRVFKLGELFCGPGGLALGALRSSTRLKREVSEIEHAWAVDYDQDTCETYRKNLCANNPESVICTDVRKLDLKPLRPIDAFAYGFPCNDFSIIGEKKGIDGEFGPLYMYGIQILNLFKPKFFVAENVGGITSANDGQAFRTILADLESAGNGYILTTHLFKCEDYGIPQMRHRIIIVGIDKKYGIEFRVPVPTTPDNPETARDALEKPPIPPDVPNQELTSQSKVVVERLGFIRPGQNAWNANLPDKLKINVKGAKLSNIYRRLDPDRPAYTITGSGGGGTHSYHWVEPRALTNRERARIQTFPDNFEFIGKKESVRRQIGMAVPPKMSEIIFTSILKTLNGTDYPSITANWEEQPKLFSAI